MTGDRARGAVLYAVAAALLAAGVAWWVSAAPAAPPESPYDRWRRSALELLPDDGSLEQADTVALGAGADHEVVAAVGGGDFAVALVCVGDDGSQVRVSMGGTDADSGMRLRCTGERSPGSFNVTVPDDLRMIVSVGDTGPVVFRYSLQRTN